ncbi:MAG: hypothetical protein R2764_02855 [Bacteroidales bacterium]
MLLLLVKWPTLYWDSLLSLHLLGPYVFYLMTTLLMIAASNNNGEADYNELIDLDVALENLGSTNKPRMCLRY